MLAKHWKLRNLTILPFSSNCNWVFTYSVGNVMQISIPPVIPPAIIPKNEGRRKRRRRGTAAEARYQIRRVDQRTVGEKKREEIKNKKNGKTIKLCFRICYRFCRKKSILNLTNLNKNTTKCFTFKSSSTRCTGSRTVILHPWPLWEWIMLWHWQ